MCTLLNDKGKEVIASLGTIHVSIGHELEDGDVYPARACASKGLCDRSWRLYIVVTPRAHARARGYVIGRGVCILYIVYKSALFFGTNLISPKILTFRGLF